MYALWWKRSNSAGYHCLQMCNLHLFIYSFIQFISLHHFLLCPLKQLDFICILRAAQFCTHGCHVCAECYRVERRNIHTDTQPHIYVSIKEAPEKLNRYGGYTAGPTASCQISVKGNYYTEVSIRPEV